MLILILLSDNLKEFPIYQKKILLFQNFYQNIGQLKLL